MIKMEARIVNEITKTATQIAYSGLTGVLFGYVYGKLAALPASQIAKAGAIWSIVEKVIEIIACTFTENETSQAVIRTTVTTISTAVGIQELRKRGLLGDKMTILLIIYQALLILAYLQKLKK
jgi:hypothetical protein